MTETTRKSPALKNAEKKTTRRTTPRALELPPTPVAPMKKRLVLNGAGILGSVLKWFRARRAQSVQGSKLRVAETIQLGDKRFVSVIHVDGQRFLIGGSSTNVALLTQLDVPEATFDDALRHAAAPRKRATGNRARRAA